MKLKIIQEKSNKNYIAVELPRKLFKAKGIPDYITIKNINELTFIY